ncbi:MAG: BolA family transcriptional regulator [Rhodospirillaceae bacterium]|jgi:stress-induced morphogen|nr:BolA family transcriptional regulator [Rhodospirillaceae bacterium]MDD9916373.1 BolA family transcriptional regulator [Rhodospirillaceae bacterium]MDD9929421.1 BolA family transcriptional regulator [Rhodospirillaceae bacterium]|tara:strand:+ start:111 stop:350 length:240 start_codon:yes stop_codon:yes gene_type:complete
MAMNQSDIVQMIKEAIPDAEVQIEDLRGDGDHYAAYVRSAEFKGKTRVQQHQMVYKALQGRMGNELHALALQTSVPDTA